MILKTSVLISAVLVLLLIRPSASNLQVKAEPDQRYLILEVAKLSTLEKELNDAAGLGFRLRMSASSGIKAEGLMERLATPPDVYQYRIVATFAKKTGEKEMNEAAAQGFRVVPHTFMVKQGLTAFNMNTVVIMEKEPKITAAYEYKTIAAFRTSNFDKELKAASVEGWIAIDMVYGAVVLERAKR